MGNFLRHMSILVWDATLFFLVTHIANQSVKTFKLGKEHTTSLLERFMKTMNTLIIAQSIKLI
ncbi:MAG: hypothetical protein RBG13Loki_2844 [Promethearchaeota archaeon CR_4]|nr:MAG: hypothetical protein RBG13Loki_2844 [Candidatus Lokiarchaeota archaeon CR_4]